MCADLLHELQGFRGQTVYHVQLREPHSSEEVGWRQSFHPFKLLRCLVLQVVACQRLALREGEVGLIERAILTDHPVPVPSFAELVFRRRRNAHGALAAGLKVLVIRQVDLSNDVVRIQVKGAGKQGGSVR